MRWIALFLTLLLTVSSGWGRTFVSVDGKRAIKATLLGYDPKKETVKKHQNFPPAAGLEYRYAISLCIDRN